MGLLLNLPGTEFQAALNSEIYVDKSGLLVELNKMINTQQKYICVSRPRRFGKTMAMNMMLAYYNRAYNSETMFSGLMVENDISFTKHLNKYDVIKITMTEYISEQDSDVEKSLNILQDTLKQDIVSEYKDVDFSRCNYLWEYFTTVYLATGNQFIILIDEWDSIYREREDDVTGHKIYLNFLRNWLKNKEYIAMAYMTGILPIKKYGKHSALNMFEEFSMTNPGHLAEFVGFTSAEVQYLCDEYFMDYNEVRTWYDGYLLRYKYRDKAAKCHRENKYEVYAPLSVVKAMLACECHNYWNKTETYEALKRYIILDMEGLKEKIIELVAGGKIRIDISSFSNNMGEFANMDDVFVLLVHLGYLGYDSSTEEVFIPNNEVRTEFATSIKTADNWETIARAINASDELLQATLNMDSEFVAQALEKAHFETSILQYNDENALSYVISLAYYTARRKYILLREMPAGKGFADMAFIPRPQYANLPAMLVELKWNKSAQTAIDQIKEKNYLDVFKDYNGKVLIVGINYSKDISDKSVKKHSCIIEEIYI